jgi:predicted O-methyltransferase YrrM
MTQELWTSVDQYLVENLIPADPALDAVLQSNKAAGLPTIDVAPNQGKLLHLFARIQGARRILEIGTLGGYSTIWLARALPSDGKLITLEVEPKHAEVAKLHSEGAKPFDLILIDADKQNIPAYLDLSLSLSRPGTVIITDNVIRDGAVINSEDPDPRVQGVRRFFEKLATNPHLDSTSLQTVGSKGYDGFAIAIVKSVP